MNQEENSVDHDRRSMPEPCLDDIQYAFDDTWPVRLALNTLEAELPMNLQTTSLREVFTSLRDKLEEKELEQIRSLGHQEYLLIKPLASDIGGPFAEHAAVHVRALDDMGLVVRLD